MALKVILTGATGFVGQGVLLACLNNPAVSEVLVIGRRQYDGNHSKMKQLVVNNFFELHQYSEQLKGYDACFYCAGISSIGMNEKDYTRITYDTTMDVAQTLFAANPLMVFNFVTGRATDSTEKSRMMWARVKGKTENALQKVGFKGQYNFRPGYMHPMPGQKKIKFIFKFFGLFYPKLFPSQSLTLQQVAQAMITTSTKGYKKSVMEVQDIKAAAAL